MTKKTYSASTDKKKGTKNLSSKPKASVLLGSNGTHTSKLRIVVLVQNSNLQVKFDYAWAGSLTLRVVNTFELTPMKQKHFLKKEVEKISGSRATVIKI